MEFVPYLQSEWCTAANAFRDTTDDEHSVSTNELFEAYQIISAWKLRFTQANIPIFVQASGVLIQARLNDIVITDGDLPLWIKDTNVSYVLGIAITRFVNFISALRPKLDGLTTAESVEQHGIPTWVVKLRHDIVHGTNYPTLPSIREGFDFCWTWIAQHFWRNASKSTEKTIGKNVPLGLSAEAREKSYKRFLTKYLHLQEKKFKKNDTIANRINDASDLTDKRSVQLVQWLSNEETCTEFFRCLLNEDYLLLNAEQLKYSMWEINDNLSLPPLLLQTKWVPMFAEIKNSYRTNRFIEMLFEKIASCCLDDKNSKLFLQLIGWFLYLVQQQVVEEKVDITRWPEIIKIMMKKYSSHNGNLHFEFFDNVCLSSGNEMSLLMELLSIKMSSFEEMTNEEVEHFRKIALKNVPLELTSTDNNDVIIIGDNIDDCVIVNPPDDDDVIIIEPSENKIDNWDNSVWKISKKQIRWVDCPLGVFPGQTLSTLDLKLTTVSDENPLTKDY